MRKLLFCAFLLTCNVAALAQSPPICRVQKTFLQPGSTLPDPNATVTVYRVLLNNYAYSRTARIFRTNASGVLLGVDGQPGMELPCNATVFAYSAADTGLPELGSNPSTGTQYTVRGTNPQQLEELIYAKQLLTTKGGLIVRGTDIAAQLLPGVDGTFLRADSSQPLGLRYDLLSYSSFPALTASRALISNGSGVVSVSSVTDVELGYLSGVTANLQTQLNGKAGLTSPGFAGVPTAPTATAGTNTLQLATTAFVQAAVAASTAGVSTFNGRTGTVLPQSGDYTFAQIGSKPTTLSGYGVTDGQPLNTDLTVISGLTPSNDDVLQRKAGAWTNRTLAQLRTDLGTGDVSSNTATSVDSEVVLFNGTTGKSIKRATGTGYAKLTSGVLSVQATPIPASDVTGAALTKTDDTNVTLTLGGTPSTALLNAASITVGWTGTLAAGRLNSNVVQSVVNDTNITGSISAQALTLGFTGALAKARQNAATAYTDAANTFGNFVQTFQAGANHLLVDPTDTTKKFQFDASNIGTGTTRTVNIPNTNSTTIQASSAGANQFATGVSAQGVVSYAQPAFSNLSGSLTSGQDYTTGVSANTYRSVTVNTTGRVTGGTNPTTFSGYGLSDTSANLAASLTDESGNGAAVFANGAALTGGTHTGLTSLGIRSTGTGAFDLTLANTENLTAGRTLTITVNDVNRTLNINGSATLGNGSLSGTNTGDQTITLTGDVTGSGTGSFAATIGSNAVTDAKLRQGAATSVIGRSANTTGNVADITASADGQFLRRSSGALGFAAIGSGDLPAALVYNNQGNTYSTGNQDFGAATSLKIPTAAGASPTANGLLAYDSTSNTFEYGENGTNRTVANLDSNQSFSNKTLVTPTIASFVNATHTHQNAAGGGTLDGAAIATGTVVDARLSSNVFYVDGTRAGVSSATSADGFTWTANSVNTGDHTMWNATGLTSGSLLRAAIPQSGFTGRIIDVRDNAGSPVDKFVVDNAGKITVGAADAALLTSGTLVAGRMPALSGDVTSSAGSVSITVTKLNGTSLAGLATGLLKNTTSTGVPSIAAASDVYGLWSGTCNSSTFLRGDGSCASPSGSGDVSSNTATSVDSEVVLFNGTTGKSIKRATGTGYAKLTSGVLSVQATPIPASDVTGAALTKTDDTNVTLTLGGTPSAALLNAASITVGWTGTLAKVRQHSATAYTDAANTFAARTILSGGLARTVRNVTGNATIAATDVRVDVNGSGANTQTLPSLAAVEDGWETTISDVGNNAGTNNITVSRAGADTFLGGNTAVVITCNRCAVGVRKAGSVWALF